MEHTELEIKTDDGLCTTHVYEPEQDGPWPAVIVYMDAVGVRPAMMEIAERIAGEGYYVLLPDLFYRVPDFDPSQGLRLFTDPEFRKDMMSRVIPTASAANVMRDTERFLTFLHDQPDVDDEHLGITGYCMGGRLALCAAGYLGDRVSAIASYHPGGVATDAPDSAHRVAGGIRGRVYIARAIDDAGFDDAAKARLEDAYKAANVDYELETYNARHGFVPRDTPVHDKTAAARHWQTLLALFEQTLRD